MFVKFKKDAPTALKDLLENEVGQVIAEETRDSVAFVNVQFENVEACGLPLDMFEVLE